MQGQALACQRASFAQCTERLFIHQVVSNVSLASFALEELAAMFMGDMRFMAHELLQIEGQTSQRSVSDQCAQAGFFLRKKYKTFSACTGDRPYVQAYRHAVECKIMSTL